MKIAKKAETALKLLRACVDADDQDACDFLVGVIERDALYRYYASDDGTRCESMSDFVAQMNAECGEAKPIGTRPTASAGAGNRPLCEMTTEERYQARLALARQ